jgi:uncharacterized protein (TIRG00374 family)
MTDDTTSPTSSTDVQTESSDGVGGFVRRRFVLGVAFGLLVTAALVFFNDGQRVLHTLHGFNWALVPLILLLSLSNYLLRFIKWHLYLRWVGSEPIAKMTSLVIFLSGLSMAITPGKVGEFLKPYLVRRTNGTAFTVTAPIVISERITDGAAMLVLASIGLLQVRHGWILLGVLAVGFVVFTLLLQRRTLVQWILHRLEHISLIGKRAEALETLYESTWRMFRPGRLLIAVGISTVSWAGECLAFFLVLIGLGFPADAHILFVATSSLAIATLIGAISLLPGGLGAAELSVTGLLLLFIGSAQMDHEMAATATLLIRFATFWFGILIGLGALLASEWYLNRVAVSRQASEAA